MKLDWITTIVLIIMIACAIYMGVTYNHKIINECTSNPLVYAAQKYEAETGKAFSGQAWFDDPATPTIMFNSTHVDVRYLKDILR